MTQAEEHEALKRVVIDVIEDYVALFKGEGEQIATSILAAIAEKAKDWPTGGMRDAYRDAGGLGGYCAVEFAAMLAVSPLTPGAPTPAAAEYPAAAARRP